MRKRNKTSGHLLPPGCWRRDWLWIAGLIVATLLAYQAVWHAGFIWDDDENITANAALRTGRGLWAIWFAPGTTQQYYPLTNTTFWLEYHLWQLNPLGYHIDNVLLHICNAVLFGLVLRKLDVPGAWLAATLFALHPVNVDSVAWATERKNTLSGLFYLASLFAAVEFWKPGEENPPPTKPWSFYWLALLFYLAALSSKTATVPLPLVILLLIWWKRPKLTPGDFYLLIPFLLAGFAMGLMTLWVEKNHVGTNGTDWAFSWPDRFIIIGKQLWFYLGKLIWPYPLIFVYPRWPIDAGQPLMYVPSVAAAGGVIFLWLKRKSQWRPVLIALAYFVLLILPASAVFNQYYFRYSFVSDHFQYLASMGPLALAAVGITYLLDLIPPRESWLRPVICGILFTTLATLTWFQSQAYGDIETLWRTTLAQNPTCWMAYNNLGVAMQKTGRDAESIEQYQRAINLKPDDAESHNNLGLALQKTGHPAEAIEQYESAIRLKPDYADAHNNLGVSLGEMGRFSAAMDQFQQSLGLKPDNANAHNNLGFALQQTGRTTDAIDQYQLAISLKPDYAEAHFNLGNALLGAGQLPEAIDHYQQAVSLKPDYADARNNLGNALLRAGRTDEAMEQFQQTVNLKPNDAGAHNNFGVILGRQGRFAEAIDQFQQALQINPNYSDARNNLANAQAFLKSKPASK